MRFNDFIIKWNGKNIDYDGYYGYQCTDFVRQYCFEMFGDTYKPIGNAGELFNQDWGEDYIKYENTPEFIPIEGDICIFNGPLEYGHIGVVISATLTDMVIIDQNTGSGNGDGIGLNSIRIHNYNYSNIIGFIRYKTMNKFGKLITYKGLSYQSSIYGIPVVFKKTTSKTLMGFSSIKGYAPKSKKDEIFIFDNTFTKGQEYLLKVIIHESFHFFQHLVFSDEQNKYLEDLFKFIPDKVSDYAKTLHWEDGAETFAYGEIYIKNNKELPKGKIWNEALDFKYNACKKFVDSRENKLIELITERKA